MMRLIVRIFGREFGGLNQTALVLAIFTFLSQVLALLRDRLLAGKIGVGDTLDVYYAAFKIPDLLFAFGAMMVSVSVLIPFFAEYRESGQEKHFINQTWMAFFAFMSVASIILFITIPYLSPLFFPGFADAQMDSVITASRIMLISPIILGISNLFGTINQTYKKFFVYALAPVLYNVGILFGIIFLFPVFGINGLMYGVIVGALMHAAIQFPSVYHLGLVPQFVRAIDLPLLSRILLHSFPRAVTLGLSGVGFLVLTSIASSMSEGSISILSLARNLNNVPVALIGVSFSVAAFPTLADFFQKKKFDEFIKFMIAPMRGIIFWSFPAVIGIIILRAHIVRLILGTGEFGWWETRLLAAMLAAFVITATMQGLILLFTRGFYAAGKTFLPLLISIFGTVTGILSAVGLLYLFNNNDIFARAVEGIFRVSGIPGTEIIILPVGYTIGIAVQSLLLLFVFSRHIVKKKFARSSPALIRTVVHSTVASIGLGIGIYGTTQILSTFITLDTFASVFAQAAISGSVGVIAWVAILLYLKNEDFQENVIPILKWVSRKISR